MRWPLRPGQLPSALPVDDLLQTAQSGDRGALERLIERELPALRAFVRVNVPPSVRARESCSDLVQSVCREILADEKFHADRGPEAFRAWMFRWALNKIRDRTKFHHADRRDEAREQHLDDAGLARLYASIGSPSAEAIARENVRLVEAAMDLLADEDRLVIGMCHLAGMSREAVAESLGKSVVAVRKQLSRALVRLGLALRQVGADAD